jgi:hypothetical protein
MLIFRTQVILKHRAALTRHIALRAGDIRYLSPGQIIFLLTMHDMESMRSAAGLPSSLVTYFTNLGLNSHPGLNACMESIAEKVGLVSLGFALTSLNTVSAGHPRLRERLEYSSCPAVAARRALFGVACAPCLQYTPHRECAGYRIQISQSPHHVVPLPDVRSAFGIRDPRNPDTAPACLR